MITKATKMLRIVTLLVCRLTVGGGRKKSQFHPETSLFSFLIDKSGLKGAK